MKKKAKTKRRSKRRSSGGKLDFKTIAIMAGAGIGAYVGSKLLADFAKKSKDVPETVRKYAPILAGAGVAVGAAYFVRDAGIRAAIAGGAAVPIAIGVAQVVDNKQVKEFILPGPSLAGDDDMAIVGVSLPREAVRRNLVRQQAPRLSGGPPPQPLLYGDPERNPLGGDPERNPLGGMTMAA